MKKLENKTVLITGGLSGNGKACAIETAKHGANIAIADIRSSASDKAMDEIKKEHSFMTGTSLEMDGGYLAQ